MNIDKYLDREYNESKYNCASLTCEVWKDLTGIDISNALGECCKAREDRRVSAHGLAVFQRLNGPVSPCIALFQVQRREPHVGIWLDGKILHITRNGVEWSCLELVMINFDKVRFYNVKSCNS